MREMLERGLVYELPVPRAAVVAVCEGLAAVEARIDRAVALGLLEQSPEGDLRVPRVLPLEVLADEALAGRAARVLYRLWWEEAESSSELQKLEIHRLAVLGSEESIGTTIGNALASNWNNKSRYREVVDLCTRTITVVRDHALLHNLARAESALGNMDIAISLFEEAFEACPDEEEKEKAAIIHNWAIRKATQGDVDGAIALYQQSLEIKEKIGDAQGKAATLHQMAVLKAQQGEVDGAIALYQQSLEIEEKIGNVQGRAITLATLGQLLADAKGETETAIDYLSQSLTILEKIRSPSALTVQAILNRISG